MQVSRQLHPVVLVHGWKSHPGIWKKLIMRLEKASVKCWNFDHTEWGDAGLAESAALLREYILMMRTDSGYKGYIDIVCHSMGTCIARYMLEVLDGDTRNERIRQLIGIGPPNNGSSLAELFNDPEYGPQIIRKLAGVFVPRNYDPSDDIIVQEFRPCSNTMTRLRSAGLRDDICYRIIMTANHTGGPDFFPCLEGKTWELSQEKGWQTTYSGDGIVPHRDSYLPGASLCILPSNPLENETISDRYCHINLPGNPEVIDQIVEYLCNHSPSSREACPDSRIVD